jgi:small subunit ribosomal protein S18
MPKPGKPPARRRPAGRGRGRGKYVPRRKVCPFCVNKVKVIDYKEISLLRRFISDRGRMEPRRKTGVCAKHQRVLSVALKRARHIALLPYTADHIRQMGVLAPREHPVREPVPRQPVTKEPVTKEAGSEDTGADQATLQEGGPAETESPQDVPAEDGPQEQPG